MWNPFVYLGSVLDKLGGAEGDTKKRLALARTAFTRLQNIWRSGKLKINEELEQRRHWPSVCKIQQLLKLFSGKSNFRSRD